MSTEKKLNGKKVLVTRAQHQSAEFVKLINREGAEAICSPMIEIEHLRENPALHKALDQLDQFDWLVFTSENAVEHFFLEAKELNLKMFLYPNLQIATLGDKTKGKLEQLGYRSNFVPIQFTAEVLAENMDEEIENKKVLIPQSDIANNNYIASFEKRGAKVTTIPVYRNTLKKYEGIRFKELFSSGIDYITFTSASCVRSFFENAKRAKWGVKNEKLICIGPSTTKELNKHELNADAIAQPHTVEGMITAIIEIEENE